MLVIVVRVNPGFHDHLAELVLGDLRFGDLHVLARLVDDFDGHVLGLRCHATTLRDDCFTLLQDGRELVTGKARVETGREGEGCGVEAWAIVGDGVPVVLQ